MLLLVWDDAKLSQLNENLGGSPARAASPAVAPAFRSSRARFILLAARAL
jgi:hypothetical protein